MLQFYHFPFFVRRFTQIVHLLDAWHAGLKPDYTIADAAKKRVEAGQAFRNCPSWRCSNNVVLANGLSICRGHFQQRQRWSQKMNQAKQGSRKYPLDQADLGSASTEASDSTCCRYQTLHWLRMGYFVAGGGVHALERQKLFSFISRFRRGLFQGCMPGDSVRFVLEINETKLARVAGAGQETC